MNEGTVSIREEKRRIRRTMNRQLQRLEESDAQCAGSQLLERVIGWLHGSEHTDGRQEVRARVFAFASFGTEPDTWQLLRWLWNRNRSVWLPRVEGRRMRFCEVSGEEDLAPTGYRGIAEPANTADSDLPASGDLIIVPGLAFTIEGARLGRGGGHYDRFLATLPAESTAAGIGYPFQLIDSLPVGAHDMPVDEFWSLDASCAPSRS